MIATGVCVLLVTTDFISTAVVVFNSTLSRTSIQFIRGIPTSHVLHQEITASCRQLIIDHHEWVKQAVGWRPTPCIHGDLTECIPPGSFCPDGSFFERLLAIDRAKILKCQYCYTHKGKCGLLDGVQSDYDLSGLPCPDMSRAGRELREEGSTSSVFACHAKMHIEKQTALLVIENVRDSVLKIKTKKQGIAVKNFKQ